MIPKFDLFMYCSSVFEELRGHFKESHYLCEEGDCINEQYVNAFRSEIDLKAHTTQTHGRGMSKSAVRQARTIDIDIQYTNAHSTRRDQRYDRGEHFILKNILLVGPFSQFICGLTV